ncbi:hypothetical protein F4815DRAFT_460344 [Daldinia loculata]|nr:hypothetical protein F4815DRAFT_460344 [Daldinia loculata]
MILKTSSNGNPVSRGIVSLNRPAANVREVSTQPFRDEVTEIARQYISTSGPRKLNLSHEDRTACFHALQHTTHPSSFLLAFLAAETELRRYSHPNFIRWSTCNINSSRVLCARALGVILIILAIILNVILILSKANRLSRLSAVPLWYVGFYILLMEGRGISIRLYMNQKRQLRPWEQATSSGLESVDSGANAGQIELDNSKSFPESKTRDTWIELYRQKPIWQRIFDISVVNHNRHLRALQDRVVFASLFWACFLVVVLSVGSILIPSGNMF